MNIKIHRILALIFVLIFVICIPLVLVYAMGYKFNTGKWRWEKTGVFFIKSFPKDAEIYINGKSAELKTPARLTRLLPNVYNISIQKKDYFPWAKNLAIEPQLTTFIEDASLFLSESRPELITNGIFSLSSISQDKNTLAFLEQTESISKLLLYSYDKNQVRWLWESKIKINPETLNWSPNNQKLLFGINSDYLIFNADGNALYPSLSKIFSHDYQNLIWSDLSDNILFGTWHEKLYALDLLQKKETLLIDSPVSAFYPFFGKIVYVENSQDGCFLNIYENGNYSKLLKLPESDNYQISPALDKYIILEDKEMSYLYLIDTSNQANPLNSIFKYVKGFSWQNDMLVYWNDSELWIYYAKSKQNTLIERTSQKIKNAQLHPNGVYVIAVVGDKLKAFELDGRDNRNIHELISISEPDSPFYLIDKGLRLLIFDDFEQGAGLYLDKIQ